MKLLLVNPYFGEATKHESEAATHSPPLGLGFVGTYIRDHHDCEVEIVDPVPQGLGEAEVLDRVSEADFVGIPAFTDIRFHCFDFARKAKEANPDCTLLVGGPHAYALSEKILEHYPFIDAVVRGEGELTVSELIGGRPFEEIKGITFRQDGRIQKNGERQFMDDIDDLYVDYGLLPDMELYASDIETPVDIKRLKTAYLIESRGCPFKCSYCANDHWKRQFRAVSPKKTVARMKHLVENHGIEYFRFYDDLFTVNKRRVSEFCDEIKKEGLEVGFRVLARVGTRKETLEMLQEVGLESVGIGIESGSDRMLKRVNKGITRQQIDETIKDCKELGLWMVGSFIISLPGETGEDLAKTGELISQPDVTMVNVLHLFPQTPVFEELKAGGEVDDEIWFDRAYPETIHYCREWFASAPLSFEDAKWFSLKSRYLNTIRFPSRSLKQNGLVVTAIWYVTAPFDLMLKGMIYRYAFRFKNLYRKFAWR